MKLKQVEFVLPIGYEDDTEMIHRKGTMRMATALDEIEVNNDERTPHNQRIRDLLMLSRVILNIGDIESVSSEIIENLFEADFIFLQMLYNRLNRDNSESIIVRCPHCSAINQVAMPDLYKDMHHYLARNKNTVDTKSEIQEGSTKTV